MFPPGAFEFKIVGHDLEREHSSVPGTVILGVVEHDT